jgi:hypothetical protein
MPHSNPPNPPAGQAFQAYVMNHDRTASFRWLKRSKLASMVGKRIARRPAN